MIKKENKDITNSSQIYDDEINFSLFLKPFLRNKLLIGSISFIFFLVGSTLSLTFKRVWQGEFQIVLNTKKAQSKNPLFSSGDNNLATEVQKLQSPSVLMPIFEFASSKENYPNFSTWKNNLDVQLVDNTSVLNIIYRDTNKSTIIPILEKMSNTYQEYSGSAKKRSEELQRNYLNNQISIFTKKSSNSLRIAQDFAIKEDLVYNDINNNRPNGDSKETLSKASLSSIDLLLPNVGIENIRVEAANQLRTIAIQLDKINSLEDDVEELIYIGAEIPALVREGLPQRVKSQEDRIITINNQLKQIQTIRNEDIETLQYIGSTIPALVKEGLPGSLKNQEDRLVTINDQLKQIQSLENDDIETLQYIGNTIDALVSENLPKQLKSIEGRLYSLRLKYTEEDPAIKRLLSERIQTIELLKKRSVKYLEAEKISLLGNRQPLINLLKKRSVKYLEAEKDSLLGNRQPLINLLKKRAISYLLASKSQAQVRMESATRPKGVLMKYKELIREAARDEKTLIGLENKLREAELEASKKQDPWELITKPTLLQNPVAPSRRVIGLQSLILGLIIGSAFAIYREKKLGLIYDEEVLKRLLPIKIISKIKLNEIYEKDKTFLFLRDYLEKTSTSAISFLSLDGIKYTELKAFTNVFKKNKVDLYDNISGIDLIPTQNSKYIIIKLGFTKVSEIINLKNYIELLNSQFQGIIVIQENDEANSINSIDIKIKSKAKFIYILISDLISNSNSLKNLNKNILLRSKSVYNYFSNLVSKVLKK